MRRDWTDAGRVVPLPELPDLESVPDLTLAERTYARYRSSGRSTREPRPMHGGWDAQGPDLEVDPLLSSMRPAGRVADHGGPASERLAVHDHAGARTSRSTTCRCAADALSELR